MYYHIESLNLKFQTTLRPCCSNTIISNWNTHQSIRFFLLSPSHTTVIHVHISWSTTLQFYVLSITFNITSNFLQISTSTVIVPINESLAYVVWYEWLFAVCQWQPRCSMIDACVDPIVWLMIDVVVAWLSLSLARLDLNVKTSERENLNLVTEKCVTVKVKSPLRF